MPPSLLGGFLPSRLIQTVNTLGVRTAICCMTTIRIISKWLLAVLLLFAGVLHLIKPGFFLKIMPPYLPLHLELVYLSGFIEISLGICLLIPRFSRVAAWGIIALLIAVFPANIYVYQHQEIVPASPTAHLIRLLFQGVLIWMAYWQTRNADEPGPTNKLGN